MKTFRFLILGWLITAAIICRAQITDPGWANTSQRDGTPSLPDQNTSSSEVTTPPEIQPPFTLQALLTQQSPASVAETITPEIQALADGLQDNPLKIYNYVHDHIKYVLYFGSKKGAELTLLEKRGNDFDQSALLVALLRAAGYNAAYQFGWMEIPYDNPDGSHRDLHHWLQLNFSNTNWNYTSNYLFNLFWTTRGYPTMWFKPGDTTNFYFQRVWVAATINSTNNYFDPAFKVSEPVTGINLASAMGFNSNNLMTAAAGTDTGTYVSGLNEAGIRGTLTGYTTNLLNYIQSNYPNANSQQILGGWQIMPSTNTTLPTYYSFPAIYFPAFPSSYPTNWANEPTNLMVTLKITFAGTNYQWFTPQLQGQRLALTYDATGLAQLWQDDTLLAQHSTGVSDTNVVLYINQPSGLWDFTNNVLIPSTFADMNVTNTYQRTNATYAILYAFEPDWGWLQERENQLDNYRLQGLGDTSRQVVSETLNIMGLNWMLQTENANHLLEAQMGILPMYYQRLGRMAQETGRGYYVDVYMELDGFISNAGWDAVNQDRQNREFDISGFFYSSLEHGIIEQLQNTNLVGASTVKMLQIANTNGQAIYLANSANWSSVQGSLVNYSSSTKTTIGNLISSSYYVLLPQNGSNHVTSATGSWAGYGYEALRNNLTNQDQQMIISGGYHGGFASDPTATVNPSYTAQSGDDQSQAFTSVPISTVNPTIADPVDTADGTFQVEHTDLSLGQSEPHGITLSRYYNGTRRFSNPAGMAGGWIHNYAISANTVAAPQAGLGGTTPAQAASLLAASAAAVGIYNGAQPDPKNWLTTALITKWCVDQLVKNGVSVILGKDTVQFVKQPNGVFTPPANCTMTLTQNGSTYSLQQRHGNTFNFDTLGRLTQITDPYSQSLSLSYNASNWVQTVTDWKNRSLTFTYSGTPQRLTSVSDSTGRSVSYGYNTAYNVQGDLTSFTDPENKATTYAYDPNHQITATFDALNQLVVSNIYDSLGHVTVQYTQGDPNKTWRIFWSGWQSIEQDPAGSRRVYSYDDQSRLIGLQDQLGNLSRTFYDGQNHVVMTVSPLNETNQFIYDGNNNLTNSIAPLGFNNQFVYDSQNNLIRSIDPRGNPSTFGYNTQFSLTGSTNGAGDWVAYSYNSDGTLHTRTDSGGTTTYVYDSTYGQLTSITYPNSLGSESFVNNALGDVTAHTDARGFTTTFGYNNRRQLTNSIAPTNLVAKIAYDPVGNAASMTDPRGNAISNTWSATRHLLATALPATSQGTPIVTNIYDNRDWLVRSLDPLHNAMQYTNDADGRLIAVTDPLSRTTTFSYDADGRNLATTNAALEITSQSWDAKGELIQLTDGAGHVVLRAYDGAGNQIILTNRNGKKWQFQFDGANRLTNTITPRGRSTTVAFNHQGLLASAKDPAGQTATYNYDAKGRLTNLVDGVASTLYKYDPNNNLTNVTETINSQLSTLNYAYDAYNRMSSFKDVYGNLIQYKYDGNGNVTNLIYPGGKNVYYTYDSNNHLTQVKDWSGRTTTMTYDLDGRLTSITRPNGTERVISYDVAGQSTNIIEMTAANLPIALFRYNWNNAAEMQWEFAAPLPHAVTVPTRTMTYDDDNRLATVNGSPVTSDLDGNLTYAPLTNGVSATQTFDARNRLISVGGTSSTSPTTNAYDALNNRVGQTYGTNITIFVVNPNANLPQVLMRIKNGVTNYYVYGAGLLYQVTETASGTNTLTYHYDYRGSTIALSDNNGNVTDRIEYSLYGLMTYRAGTNDTPFLFNGKYGVQSDGNGLLYMRARYYSPYLCRFLSADPSGFTGGLNFYAAFNGNPGSYTDPTGLGAMGDNQTISWLTGSSATPANLSDPFGLANANEQPDWVDNTIDFINAKINAFQQAQAARPEWVQQIDQFAQLAVMGMAPELSPLVAETTLPANVAATFSGGQYALTILQEEMVAYRYSGGVSAPVGNFLTTADTVSQISSPVSASIALRLPVGATAETLNAFRIPAGTQIFTGGVAGGADTATQIFIQNPSVVIPY